MKKAKFIFAYVLIIAVILCLFTVISCGEKECEHDWTDADCVKPKTCSICQETSGAELGHTWSEATCTTPKTCSVCNATEGDAIGHNYSPATCTTPKTCALCGNTEGEVLGHNYNDVLKCKNCNEYGFEYYSGTKIPDFGCIFSPYLEPIIPDKNLYYYSFTTSSKYEPRGDNPYLMYDMILSECGFICTDSQETDDYTIFLFVHYSTKEEVLYVPTLDGVMIGIQ